MSDYVQSFLPLRQKFGIELPDRDLRTQLGRLGPTFRARRARDM